MDMVLDDGALSWSLHNPSPASLALGDRSLRER